MGQRADLPNLSGGRMLEEYKRGGGGQCGADQISFEGDAHQIAKVFLTSYLSNPFL